nr:immunoglobulin heavy chain junction region [Mus musculus]
CARSLYYGNNYWYFDVW